MPLFIEKPYLKEGPPGLKRPPGGGDARLHGIRCVAEREWQFTTMGSLISPVGRNCSKYLKIFTPNKKDLNATARMHFAYFAGFSVASVEG